MHANFTMRHAAAEGRHSHTQLLRYGIRQERKEKEMKTLLETDDAWASLVLRVALGAVVLPHGAQKLLGWYGGYGFQGTMGYFTETLHLPWIIAFLVIIGESFGAIALIGGLLTRFTAASVGVIMAGAITLAHWPHGFFMNWFGTQQGEGFEYHLLVMGMSLALMISGGGKWSIDRVLSQALARRERLGGVMTGELATSAARR